MRMPAPSLQSKRSLISLDPYSLSLPLGPGRPLDAATRAFFEPRFGADFAGISVHTGPAAEGSSQELDARAYATGNHIVFGAGEYRPATQEGRRLIAHELTHAVQQAGNSAAAPAARIQRQRQPKQEKPPIPNEHPFIPLVPRPLRDLYRQIFYSPAMFEDYLLEALLVPGLESLRPLITVTPESSQSLLFSTDVDLDYLASIAFALLSSREALRTEMERLSPARAQRYQDVLGSHLLGVAIEYARRNPAFRERVLREREGRDRERRRRRERPEPGTEERPRGAVPT
jgi:hypothetical protein